MKADKEEKKRTRRACVCAFILTLCVIVTAMALYAVDYTTGRTLHGDEYHPTMKVEISATWLPARMQVLWKLLRGDYWEDLLNSERINKEIFFQNTSSSNTANDTSEISKPTVNPAGE